MTAQVVTITESESAKSGMQVIKWAWTTDSVNGAIVASTTAGEANTTTKKYTGAVYRVVTVPLTDAPTTLYDVTVIDKNAVDVLAGYGADRSATVTETLESSSLGAVYDSALSLVIANAGNSKTGAVYMYILNM